MDELLIEKEGMLGESALKGISSKTSLARQGPTVYLNFCPGSMIRAAISASKISAGSC